ncbi:MAG: endonuclease/exonuclease/phosphatase family protein [Byssovorax sp.]
MIRSSSFGSRGTLAALFLAPSLLLAAACGSGETTSQSTTGAGGEPSSTATSASGGAGGTGGNPVPAVPLTIVDWNTHNYFDAKKDPTLTGEIVLSAADYAKKRVTIGAELKALNGDIVVLAEVENKAILDDLNTSELGSAYGTTYLVQGNDPRGIDVGVLSKIAPDSIVSHKDDLFVKSGTNGPQYRYSRDCIELHFTFNQRKIIVLGVHFKAKAAPDDPDKRLAEAQHTRKIADDLLVKEPSAGILITGDFNDTPGSKPYLAVAGAAPQLFVDSADAVAVAERYSYNFSGKLELIDHQMANPALHAMLDPASVVLQHAKNVDDASKYASDHTPLKATYQVH